MTYTIEERQYVRWTKYPKNRIPFRKEDNCAKHDQVDMVLYEEGELTIEELCRRVEKTNNLPHNSVSLVAMATELVLLNYKLQDKDKEILNG